MPGASSSYHIKHFKLNILVRSCFYWLCLFFTTLTIQYGILKYLEFSLKWPYWPKSEVKHFTYLLTCLGTRTLFFAGYPAILEYRVMNGLMFWPRLPWIRQNSFIIYHILISSITSRSTLMTFCKVNGTSMSPANCSRYNQSLSDLLHQWNAEEMTLSYAGPELAMPISQTAIY